MSLRSGLDAARVEDMPGMTRELPEGSRGLSAECGVLWWSFYREMSGKTAFQAFRTGWKPVLPLNWSCLTF